MLRFALALLSYLQIGVRIKESIGRLLRQTVVIAVTVIVLIAAVAFGLFAAYQVLLSIYDFAPAEAAVIMSVALTVLGLLSLAALPLFTRNPKRQGPRVLAATDEGAIDQSLGNAMRQVGPLPLLLSAFVVGFLVSRR